MIIKENLKQFYFNNGIIATKFDALKKLREKGYKVSEFNLTSDQVQHSINIIESIEKLENEIKDKQIENDSFEEAVFEMFQRIGLKEKQEVEVNIMDNTFVDFFHENGKLHHNHPYSKT